MVCGVGSLPFLVPLLMHGSTSIEYYDSWRGLLQLWTIRTVPALFHIEYTLKFLCLLVLPCPYVIWIIAVRFSSLQGNTVAF